MKSRGRWKMQRGYAGLSMKMTRTRDQATCKMKWADSCIMMSRSCSACGKDGTGMTTMAGGFQTCVPRQDVQKWSTFVATTCIQGSLEKPACCSPKKKLYGWRIFRIKKYLPLPAPSAIKLAVTGCHCLRIVSAWSTVFLLLI